MSTKRFSLSSPKVYFLALVIAGTVLLIGNPSLGDQPRRRVAATRPVVATTRPVVATAPARTDRIVQIYKLTNAEPSEIADAIAEVFDDQTISYAVNERTKSIIASGTEKELKTLAALICELDAPAPPKKQTDARIFPLKYTDVNEMREALNSLFSQDVEWGCSRFSNQLVVSGPANELERIGKLISDLDVPSSPGPDRDMQNVTRVYALRHIDVDEDLARPLEMVLGDRGELALDKHRRLVIVKAPESLFPKVEDILEKLDIPLTSPPGDNKATRRIRIVWLINGPDLENMSSPPEDLKGVIDGLAEIGVTNLKLAAQAIVQTLPDSDRFQMICSPRLQDRTLLNIEGRLFQQGGEHNRLEIELEAREAGSKNTLAQVRTTLTAPMGHPVVLAVSPTDNKTSVFVVQILPAN